MKREDVLLIIILLMLSIVTALSVKSLRTELYISLSSHMKNFLVLMTYIFLGLTLISIFASGSFGKIVSIYLLLSTIFIAILLGIYSLYAPIIFIATTLASFSLAYCKKEKVVILANMATLLILYTILMLYLIFSFLQFGNVLIILSLIFLTVIACLCIYSYKGEVEW